MGLCQVQARVLMSFQNILPVCFGKGTEVEGSALPVLHRYSDWEGREDGVHDIKFQLEKSLTVIEKQLTCHINLYLGEDQHGAQ
jgi:hypothetical protein